MIPLLQEYRSKYPEMLLYLWGDSGFASPDLYEACEDNDCKYAIRLKLMKVAAKAVRSARYIVFKLCSSCSYKKEFYETLANIWKLQPQLE